MECERPEGLLRQGFRGLFPGTGRGLFLPAGDQDAGGAGQLDLAFEGYRSYWNYAQKKGYSGTAIFSRHEPLSVTYGLGLEEHDTEGRVITLEMPEFYLVTVYTPNSQDELRRLDYRMTWEDEFRAYLLRLDAVKPVIVCGDLNVAHKEIDLKNPKTNRMNAGFTDQERGKFSDLLAAGFTDTFRYFYPDTEGVYSWWSSTISSFPTACSPSSSVPPSTMRYSAPTTVPSNLPSTFDETLSSDISLYWHLYIPAEMAPADVAFHRYRENSRYLPEGLIY